MASVQTVPGSSAADVQLASKVGKLARLKRIDIIWWARTPAITRNCHNPQGVQLRIHGDSTEALLCPLWVISGHDSANLECLLYSRKQKWIGEAIRPLWAFRDRSFVGRLLCSVQFSISTIDFAKYHPALAACPITPNG